MTELLRSNFEQELPGLIEKIKSCHFISFDGEFSSLDVEQAEYFDFPADRYRKMWLGAQNSLIIQFGFSLVTYRGGKNYDVETFVAYTLPYPVDYLKNKEANFDKYTVKFSQGPEGSEAFLKRFNFNFEKLYLNWIPCLNSKSLKELEDYAAECPAEFIERVKSIKGDFGDSSITQDTLGEYINRAKGFTKLIEAIGDSKKPFIGHNIICDLIFAYNMFVAPAPESYEEFKKVVHSAFPMNFDTKAMALRLYNIFDNKTLKMRPERELVHRTGLYTLFRNLSKVDDKFVPVFALNPSASARYSEGLEQVKLMENPSINCHEAGFDSLLTGMIYLNLAHVAARICLTFLSRPAPPTYDEYFMEIEHYSNYVYLHRATISEINLKGVDKKVRCPDWLQITLPHFVDASASSGPGTSGATEVKKAGVDVKNVDNEIKQFKEKLNDAEIYSALYDIKRLKPEIIDGQLRSVILMSFKHKSCVTKTFNFLAKQKNVTFRRVNFKGETLLKHILEASAPHRRR